MNRRHRVEHANMCVCVYIYIYIYKTTTAENTPTSTFIRKPDAATAV